MLRRWIIWLSLGAFFLFIPLACETYDYSGSLNSPASCLRQITQACQEHFFVDAVSRYTTALDDNFKFYFSSQDVGVIFGDFTVPGDWNRTYEQIAVKELFNRVMAITFTVDLLENDQFPSPPGGAEQFTVNQVQLSFMVDQDGETTFVATGTGDFVFAKQEDNRWKVLEWHDHTNETAHLDDVPRSIGSIKAEYYSKHFK